MDAPPDVPRDVPGNPLSRLLPAVMVVATVGMMIVYFTSGTAAARNPMFMFFPVMMLGSLIGTVAMGTRGGSRAADINQDRRAYLRYLGSLEASVAKTADAQHVSLTWNHPNPGSLWMLVGGRRMWERRPEDSDFGHVRVGMGTQSLSTRLVAPALPPVEQLDPVTSMELRRLIHTRSMVPDLPVALALTRFTAVTLRGDTAAARNLVRAMVCQLAVLHSPKHLCIVAVVDPLTSADWDWLKWLPHHQHPRSVDDGGPIRMTYESLASAETALAHGDGAHAVLLIDGGLVTGGEGLFSPGGVSDVTVLEVGTECDDIATQNGLRLC